MKLIPKLKDTQFALIFVSIWLMYKTKPRTCEFDTKSNNVYRLVSLYEYLNLVRMNKFSVLFVNICL